MTVTITKKGNVPSERVYTASCKVCHTEFMFNPPDATYRPDQRDGDYYMIDCPICENLVYVNV